MPRIYNSLSEPLDFCQRCFPSQKNAEARYACLGDGPDDRGNCFDYDVDHPDYDECEYHCEQCGCRLTSASNEPRRHGP